MSLKHIVSLETAKKLHAVGLKNENPEFGDVFYTVHPDTKQVDTVVVGSAKWHISSLLPMYRAPSLQDLIKLVGDDYAIRYEKKRGGYWTIEKVKSVDFSVQEVDFMVNSFPIGYHENPITLIVDIVCG